jgi:hypothetical protein
VIAQSVQWLGYGLDDRGSRVRFPAGAGNFSLPHRVQNGSGAHPPSYPMGTVPGALFLGVKRPGREANHSLPSSVEVKECVELYLQFPIRLNGVVVSLKKSTGTTLPLPLHFIRHLCIPPPSSFSSSINRYNFQPLASSSLFHGFSGPLSFLLGLLSLIRNFGLWQWNFFHTWQDTLNVGLVHCYAMLSQHTHSCP